MAMHRNVSFRRDESRNWAIRIGIAVVSLCGLGAAPIERARPTDAWIAAATKMALIQAQAVEGRAIGADARNGEVTLHGMVGSEAEKQRATALTQRVEGVERVRNTLTIVPPEERPAVAMTDDLLMQRVAHALRMEGRLADTRVGIHAVDNGVVVLAGAARTVEEHRLAVDTAAAVYGVRRVTSEIRSPDPEADEKIWQETAAFVGSADEASPFRASLRDAWTETRLGWRLWLEPGLSPAEIDVESRHGIVTLFGVVDSIDAKLIAQKRALEVEGVLHVDNQLQIVPEFVAETVAAVDAGLEEDIAERLESKDLADAKIAVEVHNAAVRLTGSVANQEDRMTALVVAGTTHGVRAVYDALEVKAARRG
jgi:osmotically-inducible protein OsmY